MDFAWTLDDPTDDTELLADDFICDDCETVIPHCQDCDHNVCITCQAGYHQTPDFKHCEANFANCIADNVTQIPFSYALDKAKNEYWCSTCKEGFFWNNKTRSCSPCSQIDSDCLTCGLKKDSFDSVCFTCDGGRMPTPNGKFCTD